MLGEAKAKLSARKHRFFVDCMDAQIEVEPMLHRRPLKVIIIGAGTGGLCLAQGLQSSGIGVEVFERDRTPIDRLQGYRLSINAQGSRALKACSYLKRSSPSSFAEQPTLVRA
jgi:hypothetical protein